MADNKFHCIILKGGDKYPYFPRPLLSEFDFSIPLTSAPTTAAKKKKKKANGHDMDLDGLTSDESEAEESNDDVADGDREGRALEQNYLLKGLQAAQMADLVDSTAAGGGQRAALARLELDIDKTLLQLLAIECREGEERGMRALEVVKLLRDRSGKMAEAAGKIAERYGRTILGEKIREMAEEKAGSGRGKDAFGDDDDDEFR